MRIDESREMDSASRRTFRKLAAQMSLSDAAYAPYKRNILHNGQFNVNQRIGPTIAGFTSSYLSDRWLCTNSSIGVQNVGVLATASFGFNTPPSRPRPANIQYFQVTTPTAAPAAAAFCSLQQGIEGQNLQFLNWGFPQARPVVATFDVFSTVTGTYVVELLRGTLGRSISRTFTVTGGAWTTVTLTFPGDTTSIIPNTTANELSFNFYICGGTAFTTGPLNSSWGTRTVTGIMTGISNGYAATVNNVFAVTNVQFEAGTVATPYQIVPYADELQTCLRYYERWSGGVIFHTFGAGHCDSTAHAFIHMGYRVEKRAVPTWIASPAAANFALTVAGLATVPLTAIAINQATTWGVSFNCTTAGGLTANAGTVLLDAGPGTAILEGGCDI